METAAWIIEVTEALDQSVLSRFVCNYNIAWRHTDSLNDIILIDYIMSNVFDNHFSTKLFVLSHPPSICVQRQMTALIVVQLIQSLQEIIPWNKHCLSDHSGQLSNFLKAASEKQTVAE